MTSSLAMCWSRTILTWYRLVSGCCCWCYRLFFNSATVVADRGHLAKATGSRLPLSIPTCAESTLHSRLVLICGQDSRLALSPRSPLRLPMQPLGSSNVTRASQGIINKVCVLARARSMLYLSVVLLLLCVLLLCVCGGGVVVVIIIIFLGGGDFL